MTVSTTESPTRTEAISLSGAASSRPRRVPKKQPESRTTALDRWLVRFLLKNLGLPNLSIELWDGTTISGSLPLRSRVRIRDRRSLLSLLWQPSIGFGKGYRDGRIEVDGSLVALAESIEQSNGITRRHQWNGFRGFGRHRSRSLRSSRNNIHRHYDLGNDFYRLWLDDQLVYTCAWFPDPEMSLEDAQIAKMDLVCRKLQLQPGQGVVEAGCGWGALALHMARHYGVRVTAYNISEEQVAWAQDRACQEGLADQVRFIHDDWRNIRGSYDAFASVGMLEHVGPEHYKRLGKVIAGSLKPSGLGLIHTIGRNIAHRMDAWTERYIFPGAEPPSLRQMMDIFEGHRYSILDVENLRLHYAKTLGHWLERFEQHTDVVTKMFDESFVRVWRLYLSASIAAFRFGDLQLFQVLFSHPQNNDIPWTRSAFTPD